MLKQLLSVLAVLLALWLAYFRNGLVPQVPIAPVAPLAPPVPRLPVHARDGASPELSKSTSDNADSAACDASAAALLGDCCHCDTATLHRLNEEHVYAPLHDLVQTDLFRLYCVNLEAHCADTDAAAELCMRPDCALQQCHETLPLAYTAAGTGDPVQFWAGHCVGLNSVDTRLPLVDQVALQRLARANDAEVPA
jgi:hypothetical protein